MICIHRFATPHSYSPLSFSNCQSSSARVLVEIESEWRSGHLPLRLMSLVPVFWAAEGGHLYKGRFTLGAADSLDLLGSVASQLKHLAACPTSTRSHRNGLKFEGVTGVATPNVPRDLLDWRDEINGLHIGTYSYRIIETKFSEYNRLQTTTIYLIAEV